MSLPIRIYNFHRISDEYSPAYPPIPIKTFERIVRYLCKKYLIVPQYFILEKTKPINKKPLLIVTFDDAFLDFQQYALPILEKHKIPVTQHIITECAETGYSFWTQRLNKTIEAHYLNRQNIIIPQLDINTRLKDEKEVEFFALKVYRQLLHNPDKEKIVASLMRDIDVSETPMMTWKEIKSLPKDIVTIGSHTHNHLNLKTLSDEAAREQMQLSYDLIKENLGFSPISIAYPNGQFSDTINNAAQEIGYKIGYSCDNCKNIINGQFTYHRYNLYNRSYLKNRVKIFLFEHKQ